MFINPLSQVLGSSYSCLIHTLIQQRQNLFPQRLYDSISPKNARTVIALKKLRTDVR
jgi:hypothetical protein